MLPLSVAYLQKSTCLSTPDNFGAKPQTPVDFHKIKVKLSVLQHEGLPRAELKVTANVVLAAGGDIAGHGALRHHLGIAGGDEGVLSLLAVDDHKHVLAAQRAVDHVDTLQGDELRHRALGHHLVALPPVEQLAERRIQDAAQFSQMVLDAGADR